MRGETSTRPGYGTGSVDALVFERDRERAFRRARRHTWLVRSLKILLPAAAIVSLGFYGAALMVTSRLKSRDVSVAKVSIDPTNLSMADPRYTGFAKDGSEYRIHARRAVTDLRMAAPVRLEEIDGEIIQTNGVATRLVARSGTYDQKKELLELFEQIDIDSTNGMKARLTRATVLAKEGRVMSPAPLVAETLAGSVRAASMALDTKSRRASFLVDVEVKLRPNAPVAPLKEGETAKPKREGHMLGLDASSSEPVIVQSRVLDVDDTYKTAQFREAVVARQGDAALAAPELDVHYAGKAAIGDMAGASRSAGPAAGGTEATRLKLIRARGGVVLTSKDDRAESATFDYDADAETVTLAGAVVLTQAPDRRATADTVVLDQKAETALLTGDVVVTQARNVMRGSRLAIDRKAGTARLASPAVNGGHGGRISTVLYQGQGAKPGAASRRTPAAEDADQPFGALGAGFKADPDAPVEIEAATLDVNDRKHSAIYHGGVVAKQGTFVVRTEELTAHYAGDTGLVATGQPIPRERGKAAVGGASELKRIEAKRNVVVNGNDGQQATGEWATFDVKANTIVMGGNVTVSQGKQLVRAPAGMRLHIDLGSGVTRFEPEPGSAAAAKAGPQVSGAFATSVATERTAPAGNSAGCPPGAVCKSGRLEAIFYPNQLKEKAREKAGEIGAAGAAAAEAKRSVAKRLPGASSWKPATTSPGSQ